MRWTLLTGLVVLAACRKPGATEVTKGDDTGDLTGFEGAIHFEGTSSGVGRTRTGPSWSVDVEMKGDKVRVTSHTRSGESNVTSIMDRGRNTTYTFTERPDYSESPLQHPPSQQKPTITKTGRMDKVAGHDCNLVTLFEPAVATRTELCVSKAVSLSGFAFYPLAMLTNGGGLDEILADGLPLRAEVFDGDGVLEAKMEAKSVERRPVSDSQFLPPAGYSQRAR